MKETSEARNEKGRASGEESNGEGDEKEDEDFNSEDDDLEDESDNEMRKGTTFPDFKSKAPAWELYQVNFYCVGKWFGFGKCVRWATLVTCVISIGMQNVLDKNRSDELPYLSPVWVFTLVMANILVKLSK